jgi:hypothetical protein
MEGLWRRVEPAELGGIDALALSPQDSVYHLCAHAIYKHRLQTDLIHLCDIVEAVRHFQQIIDWHQFWSWCRGAKASRCVHLELGAGGSAA